MSARKIGLGTQLRHLIDLLDGDVAAVYRRQGLDYRPRFTPIVSVLAERPGLSISELALEAGITHSAASQTVTQMLADGWLQAVGAADGRERRVDLSRKARQALPALQAQWQATRAAADSLDQQLPFPLSELLELARAALESRSFSERITQAMSPPEPVAPKARRGNVMGRRGTATRLPK